MQIHPDAFASVATAQPVLKRIALFTGAYNHIADGVSLTLNRLVAYLERQGVAVQIFAPTVEEPPVDHAGTLIPVPSVALPGRPEYRFSTRISRSVRDALRAFRPTLFHIATPDLLGYRALRLAQSWNVPVVASYHTHFSSYLKYYNMDMLEGFVWKYLRWFYAQCEAVYVPSHSMADVLREHGIVDGLRLWGRGVDTERFSPVQRSAAWRRSLGVSDDEVLVTFISRLVWEKRLDVFADVVAELQQRGLPVRSLVVGDGPARDELAERMPGTIFTGHLGGDALARAYASSDIFVFPSDTETFGNVTLEAMASGVPTVCADATGSASLVEHGTTGYLAPPGDVATFVEHVAQLVENPVVRHEMGCAALARAQEYEWDAILGRIDGYYDDVLERQLWVGHGDGSLGDGQSVPEPTVWPAPLLRPAQP